MTPEEKAKELMDKFRAFDWATTPRAKRCALKVCDEIISLDVWDYPHNTERGKFFYDEVRQIIQSL